MGLEVWYAIPSASPAKCRRTLPAWRERGYKVAVLQNFEPGEIPADIAVWSDTYPGWAGSINELCARVVPRSAAMVVSGGDDMLPDPRFTAAELAEQFARRFPDGLGVMQPQGDGLLGARTFCGSPWLGRGWIERAYGGLGPMWGGYRHNWADNELYWVARCLGALWERPDLTQSHEHFTRTGEPKPAYWTGGVERHDREDVQLFLARAWQGFPGSAPLGGQAVDRERFKREYTGTAEAYWVSRYGAAIGVQGPGVRLAAALEACARRGQRRVAIFGAGTHTRNGAGALMQPPVQVVAIIDDHPLLAGQFLWGFPVVSRASALGMDLDAVVLSSQTMEEELAKAAAGFARRGVQVVRLYGDSPAQGVAVAAA